MDLISLYYFQELSKDLNMTKTAERLYISQQTLSNHIQRLEQYYGTKLFYRLFYRKPSLSLTCAGEFVLSFAQVVGKEERNLKDILSDVEHQERGTLRFGASMARGSQFLPIILPASPGGGALCGGAVRQPGEEDRQRGGGLCGGAVRPL